MCVCLEMYGSYLSPWLMPFRKSRIEARARALPVKGRRSIAAELCGRAAPAGDKAEAQSVSSFCSLVE